MGKLNEIFVAFKETYYIEAQLGGLCKKYNNRCEADYVQQRALFNSCRLKTLCQKPKPYGIFLARYI